MSDRRPENPGLRVVFGPGRCSDLDCLVHAPTHEATPADLLAVVRRGVESGTIKGEVLWMIPDEYEHLRGSLWTGPPTDGKGYVVLVIPVSDGGSET